MAPAIIVLDDTIFPAHDSYLDLTPREINTRNAVLVVTILGPLSAALFALFSNNRWRSYSNLWSFSRLVALWFITITIVGIFIYVQKGTTNRLTFIIAVLHNVTEVLINSLLLGLTAQQGLLASWIFALVDGAIVLIVPNMAVVYIIVATIGGANDFLIFALLSYGKQWILALGALFHVASAVIVFTNIVDDVGVILFNALVFVLLWGHITFIIGGILISRDENGVSALNPLDKVHVPLPIALGLIAFSISGAAGIAITLAWVAAR